MKAAGFGQKLLWLVTLISMIMNVASGDACAAETAFTVRQDVANINLGPATDLGVAYGAWYDHSCTWVNQTHTGATYVNGTGSYTAVTFKDWTMADGTLISKTFVSGTWVSGGGTFIKVTTYNATFLTGAFVADTTVGDGPGSAAYIKVAYSSPTFVAGTYQNGSDTHIQIAYSNSDVIQFQLCDYHTYEYLLCALTTADSSSNTTTTTHRNWTMASGPNVTLVNTTTTTNAVDAHGTTGSTTTCS